MLNRICVVIGLLSLGGSLFAGGESAPAPQEMAHVWTLALEGLHGDYKVPRDKVIELRVSYEHTNLELDRLYYIFPESMANDPEIKEMTSKFRADEVGKGRFVLTPTPDGKGVVVVDRSLLKKTGEFTLTPEVIPAWVGSPKAPVRSRGSQRVSTPGPDGHRNNLRNPGGSQSPQDPTFNEYIQRGRRGESFQHREGGVSPVVMPSSNPKTMTQPMLHITHWDFGSLFPEVTVPKGKVIPLTMIFEPNQFHVDTYYYLFPESSLQDPQVKKLIADTKAEVERGRFTASLSADGKHVAINDITLKRPEEAVLITAEMRDRFFPAVRQSRNLDIARGLILSGSPLAARMALHVAEPKFAEVLFGAGFADYLDGTITLSKVRQLLPQAITTYSLKNRLMEVPAQEFVRTFDLLTAALTERYVPPASEPKIGRLGQDVAAEVTSKAVIIDPARDPKLRNFITAARMWMGPLSAPATIRRSKVLSLFNGRTSGSYGGGVRRAGDAVFGGRSSAGSERMPVLQYVLNALGFETRYVALEGRISLQVREGGRWNRVYSTSEPFVTALVHRGGTVELTYVSNRGVRVYAPVPSLVLPPEIEATAPKRQDPAPTPRRTLARRIGGEAGRELSGALKFGTAYFIKEGIHGGVAAALGNTSRFNDSIAALATSEFWKSYGAFSVGAGLTHRIVDRPSVMERLYGTMKSRRQVGFTRAGVPMMVGSFASDAAHGDSFHVGRAASTVVFYGLAGSLVEGSLLRIPNPKARLALFVWDAAKMGVTLSIGEGLERSLMPEGWKPKRLRPGARNRE